MRLARIAGTTFTIHLPALLLALGCILLGLGREVLLLSASLLLHEMAHVLVARALGIRTAEVEFTPFGGQARIEDFSGVRPDREFYVSLAGPCSSLALAAWFHYYPVGSNPYGMEWFVTCNIALGLFNLLPGLPLDGGRILQAFLSPRVGFRKATRWSAYVGIFIALILIVDGTLAFPNRISAFNEIAAGMALLWYAVREARMLAYRFMRHLIHKKSELFQRGYLESKQIVSQKNTLVKDLLHDARPLFYLIVIVIDDRHQVLGMVTEVQLIECFLDNGPFCTLRDCT